MTNQTVLLLADELDAKKSECERLKLQIEAIKYHGILTETICNICAHRWGDGETEPCKSCIGDDAPGWQPPEAPNA